MMVLLVKITELSNQRRLLIAQDVRAVIAKRKAPPDAHAPAGLS
jgi:hypothetical protein